MYQRLKETNRLNISVLIGLMSAFCFSVSIFRVDYSDTRHFLFLNWNLFLAFFPWALTSLAILYPQLQRNKLMIFSLLFVWLVFFPNAPYILTDLFHLSKNSSMPIWFDLLLILSFAWTGLIYGFMSLWDIEEMLLKFLSRKQVTAISITCMFLGGFGIYLGRYLRWNSWDILNRPASLLGDIANRFIYPFDHLRTWGLTLFMGLFLTMLYFTFRFLRRGMVTKAV